MNKISVKYIVDHFDPYQNMLFELTKEQLLNANWKLQHHLNNNFYGINTPCYTSVINEKEYKLYIPFIEDNKCKFTQFDDVDLNASNTCILKDYEFEFLKLKLL